VLLTLLSFQLSRRRPALVKGLVRRGVARRLPADFDVDTHFKPTYGPWDQRLCLVPDGDLFDALCAGSASIVTDRIDTFTERGIRLVSGAELEADLIVTATGLNLLALGGVQLVVDGEQVRSASGLEPRGPESLADARGRERGDTARGVLSHRWSFASVDGHLSHLRQTKDRGL